MTDILSGPINTSPFRDVGTTPDVTLLSPYVTIGGPNEFGPEATSQNTPISSNTTSETEGRFPIKRFVLSVSPLVETPAGGNLNYPNSGSEKWLIDLDATQLYTPGSGIGAEYGGVWQDPSEDSEASCCAKYDDEEGAYLHKAPVQGLPISFKKIYFRGSEVDSCGGITGSGCNSYYAYFPCSDPIQQICGTGNNPRDENFGIMEGVVSSWTDFDIGCGDGGSTCISGLQVTGVGSGNSGHYPYSGTPWSGQDSCDNFFAVSGCGVEVHYVNATGGPFSGKRGPFLTFPERKLYVGDYKASTEDNYITGDSAHTDCSCDEVLVFSGVGGINVSSRRIKATGDGFNGRDLSGACGSLVTIRDTSPCDKSGLLNCLGYFETGIRVLMLTGASNDETGYCDLNLLVNCLNVVPSEGCPCDASCVSGACVGDHVGGWGCELLCEDDCTATTDSEWWGEGTTCSTSISSLNSWINGTSAGNPFNISDIPPYDTNRTISQLAVTGTACWDNGDGTYDCATSPFDTEYNNGVYTYANYLRDYQEYIVDGNSAYVDGEWKAEEDCNDVGCE